MIQPLPTDATWITVASVAEAAGVSARAVQLVLGGAAKSGRVPTWRGVPLTVRRVDGRGGRSGLRYEVEASSLPAELRDRLAAAAPASPVPVPALAPRTAVAAAAPPTLPPATLPALRREVVLAVLAAGPPRSRGRGAAVARLAASALYPVGKRAGKPVGETTIRAWVADHERRGVLAFRRRERADKNTTKVLAWRAWDAAGEAAGLPEGRRRELAAAIHREACGLWRSGVASAFKVALYLGPFCRDLARDAGLTVPADGTVPDFCRVPTHYAARADRRRYRHVHTRERDARAYHAEMVPRVRRDRSGLLPGEAFAADVRYADFGVSRADGSPTTLKYIVFECLATNRIFVRAHLTAKGENIRGAHVLEALRDLFAAPAWGVPAVLYLDNGAEFRACDDAGDLMRLAATARGAGRRDLRVEFRASAAGAPGVRRARPYSPQSKIIEGVFSNLTRSVEPGQDGFMGGDRLAKKGEHHGRPPAPMAGDAAALAARVAADVALYNATPQQRGHIAGRSPDAAYNAFPEADRRVVTLAPERFELAFGPVEPRLVNTGGELAVRGRAYRADALATMVGERVRVRVPTLGDGSRVVVLRDDGSPMCVAGEAADGFGMFDGTGAREQSRRSRALGGALRAMAGEAGPRRDVGAAGRAFVASAPPARVPEPLAVAALSPVPGEGTGGGTARDAVGDGDAADSAAIIALTPDAARKKRALLSQTAALRDIARGGRLAREAAG